VSQCVYIQSCKLHRLTTVATDVVAVAAVLGNEAVDNGAVLLSLVPGTN
jgi:hypothetical protein